MEVKNKMVACWKCDGGCGRTFLEGMLSDKKFKVEITQNDMVISVLDLCGDCLEKFKLPGTEEAIRSKKAIDLLFEKERIP